MGVFPLPRVLAVTTPPFQDTMSEQYVHWFRNSAPYINTHRGKTFVLLFGGEAVNHENFRNIVHDIALLHSLGIRLVLVHGARPQIDENLAEIGIQTPIHNGLRVTTREALRAVLDAVGSIRLEIEALSTLHPLTGEIMDGCATKSRAGFALPGYPPAGFPPPSSSPSCPTTAKQGVLRRYIDSKLYLQVLSVLREDQEHVSRRFASPARDKLEGFRFAQGRQGLPLVPGALAHLQCRVRSFHDEGDHAVWVGEVRALAAHPGRPLLHHAGAYGAFAAAGRTGKADGDRL